MQGKSAPAPGTADALPGVDADASPDAAAAAHDETTSKPAKPKTSRAGTGTRLPEGWTPKPETVATIAREFPGLDSRREHLAFVDYWTAAPGARGRKADWDATWRVWMRKAGAQQPRAAATPRNRTREWA